MNGYAWVKPAGFVLAVFGIIVSIARWTGHIDDQLDMLSYQVNQTNNKVTSVENKIDAEGGQVNEASQQARQAALNAREQQRSMKQMNISIDSLTWRVQQIEEHLKMYGGGKR